MTASFDNSQDKHEDKPYLPKEPSDLSKPELHVSVPEKELPAHTHHEQASYSTIKTLLSWTAPGRPYRKRGKQFFMSLLLITILIEIIVFLFSDYLLMMTVLSLAFVVCALAIVPPHPYHYRLSSEGITIEDHFFLWQELYDFYFRKQHDQHVLCIRTKAFIPGELSLMLGDIHVDQVKAILLQYLPFREVIHQTMMEKSGDWLAKTFPLEKKLQ